ncbi:hypothetical protein RI367_000790 [Sorochytrium milnesiophthora]
MGLKASDFAVTPIDNAAERTALLLGLIGAWNAYTTIGIALFAYQAWRGVDVIVKRSPPMMAVIAVTTMLAGNDYISNIAYFSPVVHFPGNPIYDLRFHILTQYLTVPAWSLTLILRVAVKYNEYYINMRLNKASSGSSSMGRQGLTRVARSLFWVQQRCMKAPSLSSDTATSLVPSQGNKSGSPRPTSIVWDGGARLYRTGHLIRIYGVLAAFLGPSIVLSMYLSNCLGSRDNCTFYTGEFWILYVVVFVSLSLIPFFFVLCKEIKDCFHLSREMQITFACYVCSFICYMVVSYFPGISNNRAIQATGSNVFLVVAAVIVFTTSITVPVVWSFLYEKGRTQALLTNTVEGFQRVLDVRLLASVPHLHSGLELTIICLCPHQDEREFTKFKQVLMESFCIENGLFWHGIVHHTSKWKVLEKAHQAGDREQAQKQLVRLYRDFVQPGARFELNLPSWVVQPVTREVKNGALTIDTMSKAKDEVRKMMYENTFPRYIQRSGSVSP